MAVSKPRPSLPSAAAAFLALSASASVMAQATQTTAGEATLPTVNVKDSAEKAEPSYQAGTTRVGKLPQLPKDVPQALTIVTRQLIEDTNAGTLKEALRNVSGLTFNAAEGGRVGDNMNLRGFYSFGDLYLDGIRDVAQIKRDTFNDQQVEILRGSAAMLFGHGQAGGVINRASKMPLMTNTGSISATVGDAAYARITADVNRPIGENTAIRATAMSTRGAETTRDNVRVNRNGFAPSIRTGIGTDNEFQVSLYHVDVHDTPDFGVPFKNLRPVDVPQNNFYGTKKDFEDNNVDMVTGIYTHRFADSSELRTVLRTADYKRRLWTTIPSYNASTNSVSRRPNGRGADESTITSQTDYTRKFELGGMKHEALAGVELLNERSNRCTYNTTGLTLASVALSATPDSTASVYDGRACSLYAGGYYGMSYAAYGQDVVEFKPGWKLLAGLRRDILRDTITNASGGVATTKGNLDYAESSYRAALSWQPDDYQHYYAGWSDSFNPTADLYQFTPTQAGFPAERSKTVELGAKWEAEDGDLSLRTALYRATKTWERNTDVMTASLGSILSTRRHTDGLEFEAAGRINNRWEVFSGVAFMRALIDDHLNPAAIGMRPRNTPPWTFNLWTTYRLDGGWRVGGGIEAKGDRLAYPLATNTATYRALAPNIAPHYARLDGMVSYEQKAYTVRLNVLNLTDKYYYDSVYENGGFAVPGTTRTFQLTMEYKY